MSGASGDPGPVGVLVLVATPIGNLGDLSPRAVEALAAADAICCEDTRRTGRLLQHAGVPRRPLLVANDHTEAGVTDQVVDRLAAGERVAVVSDAGLPGLSDPGELLVRAAIGAGHRVEVVPGPSAAATALVGSGLPGGRFVFEGFLPRKGSGRVQRLAEIAAERRTLVLYEAPHRLSRTLADLAARCGADRSVVVARELTKLHEEWFRGTLAGAMAWCAATEPRGEVVVVLAGAPAPADPSDGEVDAAVRAALGEGLSARDAADRVAAELAVPRRRAYAAAVAAR